MCDVCGPGAAPGDDATDHTITHPFELKPDTDFDCLECGQHISRHPDKMSYLARREQDAILDRGFGVRAVFDPDGKDPNFAYTVGRALTGRPEFFIVGDIPQQVLGGLLNTIGDLDDGTFKAGDEINEVVAGWPVHLTAVDNLLEAGLLGVLKKFPDAVVLQVLWPDPQGKFPGDDGYDLEFRQPRY